MPYYHDVMSSPGPVCQAMLAGRHGRSSKSAEVAARECPAFRRRRSIRTRASADRPWRRHLWRVVGAGGGFLLVPILLFLSPRESVAAITATSLAVVFVNATSGPVAYARLQLIDHRTGPARALASAPGTILGALLTRFLPPRGIFDVIFGAVLVSRAL